MKTLKLFAMFLLLSYFSTNQMNAQNGGNRVEMKPVYDSKTGRVTSYLPLPTDWQMTQTQYGTQGFAGPNGIKVSSTPAESYYFNVDPYVAQMSGKAVANPIPAQTIFQSRIAPAFQQQGGKLLKQYQLQEIAQRSHQLLQSAFNRGQLQSYTIMASEWQQPNGSKSLVLLSQGVMHAQGGSSWWVSLTEVEAPAQSFEQAKEAYLFALANWQVDQQTAMAHTAELNRLDRESQARIEQSWATHNAKMRANQAAFEAQQRNHVNTYNDISDISMRGYWSRSESNDRMRNKEINMIHEEHTMTNPWDNRSLQVESGYNNYYINSNGDVIGSNDANFNPNVHRDYNNTEWRPMPRRY